MENIYTSRLIIIAIVLIVVPIFLLTTLIFYFFKFKKIKTLAKKYGIIFLCVTVSLIIIAELMGIITLATKNNNLILIPLIGTTFGLIALVGSIIILFFFINYFAIALDKTTISFIGEQIQYKNIIKIINDKKVNATFIFHKQGKRIIKKTKINKKFVPSDFFNEKITGIKVEVDDALIYYKKIIKKK